MEKLTKQQQSFRRAIHSVLKDFERNKEWADIGNWLYKLEEVVKSQQSQRLPQQLIIGKRLAQCLNPNLPPGVHGTALRIYDQLFSNSAQKTELFVPLSMGLFPFFENSSFQLKFEVLRLIEKYYIDTIEVLPLIVALTNSILPGLNENHEELSKRIYAILEKLSNFIGKKWVDGAIWVNILKSPKTRIAGFKYLQKVFKDRDRQKNNKKNSNKGEGENSIDQVEGKKPQQPQQIVAVSNPFESEDGNIKKGLVNKIFSFKALDDASTRFPNTSCLVINALLACLSQGQLLVQRSGLDLMCTYLRFEQKFLSDQDKEILTQAILHLLMKKEFQLSRRIYAYLFGQPDSEGKYIITAETDPCLRIVEQAFFRVLAEKEKPVIEAPVLILQSLFKEQEQLIPRMLPNVSYPLMKYIYQNFNVDGAKMEKASVHFLNVIIDHLTLFVDSVVGRLSAKQEEGDAVQIVKILEFFFFGLVRHRQEGLFKKEMSTDVLERIIQAIHPIKGELEGYSFVQPSLELANKLKQEFGAQIGSDCVNSIQDIANNQPADYIYAQLMHLHPNPPHSFLLPFIEGGPLSLVALSLLMYSPTLICPEQLDRVFNCLFKLLQCHLWEDQAITLIKKFEQKYPATYTSAIEICDVSQWLTYWKRLNGDIKGAGVIRMLRFLDDSNPLRKHASQNWLVQSTHIVGKLLQPVFQVINNAEMKNMHHDMFLILKNVMLNSERQLGIFIFSQKQRFMNPLLKLIESYLADTADVELKSDSIEFCVFVLGHVLPEQKAEWIQLTFRTMVDSLGGCIRNSDYLREIQVLSYLNNVTKEMGGLSKHKALFSEFLQQEAFLKIILQGLSQAKISYVKSQYIKFLTQLGDVLLSVLPNKKTLAEKINIVVERYSYLLRETDVGKLEQIIQGKRVMENRRKTSGDKLLTNSETRTRTLSQQIKKSMAASVSPANDPSSLIKELNVENKYSDTILLWNAIKHYVNFSIRNQLDDFKIQSLLSLILNSFPFSYLTFMRYDAESMKDVTREINDQIKSVSGLKKEVLEIFDILWKKHHRAILSLIIQMSDPRILVHATLDPHLVVNALSESHILLRQVLGYYKVTKLSLPKNSFHFNRDTLQAENKLMYFVYLYLSYSNLKFAKSKSKLWDSCISLLKNIYRETVHVQTKLWVFQTLSLLYEKMIASKEIILESRAKTQSQELLKSVIEDLSYVITRSREFTHKSEIKTGLKGLFSKQEKDYRLFDILKIFPPVMSEMEKEYIENKADIANSYYIEDKLFSNCFDLQEGVFRRSLAIVSARTMSTLINGLLLNAYDADLVKIVHIVRELLQVILPVCEDKSEDNQIHIELVSQILNTLVSGHAKLEILKAAKKSIFEIYMGNDFFKCTKKTLSYWKHIINAASELEDLLSELLSKETLLAGIFTGKAESTRLKIKSFERICFLIYAGKVDQYETKLKVLLESLNEVMKEGETSHPALLILILFCIRIMIIRLSPIVLGKMFKTLWPSFMTLLMQLFDKKKQVARNHNLLLAALKALQLINAMELQEFHHQKWMFFFDYFGIHIDPMPLDISQKYPDMFLTPFETEPLLMSLLPRSSYLCDFVPVLLQREELSTNYQTIPRKMVIKEPSVENQIQLRNHAYLLVQYLINTNQKRVKPNKEAIEGIIEADFISLDDYIFDIK